MSWLKIQIETPLSNATYDFVGTNLKKASWSFSDRPYVPSTALWMIRVMLIKMAQLNSYIIVLTILNNQTKVTTRSTVL